MKRVLSIAIATVLILLCVSPVYAEETSVLNLGRISAVMPEITAEIYGTGYSSDTISAKLGTETLKINEVHTFDEADAVCAYILVDLSTSMSEYIDLIKKCINTYVKGMDDNDKIVLLTFGETEVNEILEGTETKEEIQSKVEALQCNENGTVFYEALAKAYHMSNATISQYDREYVIAFSDGVDYQKGNTTYSEIKELYKARTLPLYAACMSDASQEAVDRFGQIARNSGGVISFVATSDAFVSLKEQIDDVTILSLESNSMVANGKKKQLSVRIGDSLIECKVPITRAKEDFSAPEVEAITYVEESNLIIIDFTEKVSGASSISAYEIIDKEGNRLGIESVEMADSDTRVEIKIETGSYNGEYYVNFSGITDCSSEKNSLDVDEDVVVMVVAQQGMSIGMIILVISIVMLLIAGGIVTIILCTRRKEDESASNRQQQQIQQDYEYSSANVIQEKHHIKAENVARIQMRIKTGSISEQNIETSLVSSLIVGRSSTCDVYIDDTKLSRQHFVIEYDGSAFYIMDLQSRNGTFLNGIRVSSRQVLHSGDKIMAGLSDIYVTF